MRLLASTWSEATSSTKKDIIIYDAPNNFGKLWLRKQMLLVSPNLENEMGVQTK